MKTFNTNFAIFDQLGSQIEAENKFSINVDDINTDNKKMSPGESFSIFSGDLTLLHDNTTNYSLTNQSGSTYRLNFISGTDPVFRNSYNHSGDATSVFDITKVGQTMVLTQASGTASNFVTGGFVSGGLLEVSNSFSNLNNGIFKILSVSETAVVVENIDALEGSFTLSANSDLNAFSSNGVQIGNTLTLGGSFFSNGSYEISKVTNKYVEFTSTNTLPNEGPYTYSAGLVNISNASVKAISIVASDSCKVTLNGISFKIDKLVGSDGVIYPGQLFLTGLFTSLTVDNLSNGFNDIRIVTAG